MGSKVEQEILQGYSDKLMSYQKEYGTLDVNKLKSMAYSSDENVRAVWKELLAIYNYYVRLRKKFVKNPDTNKEYTDDILSAIKDTYALITSSASAKIDNPKTKIGDSKERYSSIYENYDSFTNSGKTPAMLADMCYYYGDIVRSVDNMLANETHYSNVLYNPYDYQTEYHTAKNYFKNKPDMLALQNVAKQRYDALKGTVVRLAKNNKKAYYTEYLPAYLAKNPYWETPDRIAAAKEKIKQWEDVR